MSGGLAPPVFVVGSFRGGTTLLERLLLAHPLVAGPGFETQLFSRVRYGRRVDHPHEYASFVEPIRSARNWRDPIAEFAAAADLLAKKSGASFWVEKSPDHIYHVAPILERFPPARFVYIVRDGRDVVTSILHTPWIMPRVRGRLARIAAGAVLWELMTRAGLRLLATRRRDKTLLALRYEDLVRRPVAELARIARFLDLSDSDDAIAEWIARATGIEGNSVIDPSVQGLASSPVGRWSDRRLLDESERSVIQYLIGSTLVQAGYETVHGEPLSLAVRVRAATAKAFWLALRAQRYASTVGRGAPPYLAADTHAMLVPLLRLKAPGQ